MEAIVPKCPTDDSQTLRGTVPYWHSFVPSVHPSVGERLLTFFGRSPAGCTRVAREQTQTVGLDLKPLSMGVREGVLLPAETAPPNPKHLSSYGKGCNVASSSADPLPPILYRTLHTPAIPQQNLSKYLPMHQQNVF